MIFKKVFGEYYELLIAYNFSIMHDICRMPPAVGDCLTLEAFTARRIGVIITFLTNIFKQQSL